MITVLKIKELRKQKGISLRDLASVLNVSPQCISYYENEKRAISIHDAKRIADALGCKLDDLVDWRTA